MSPSPALAQLLGLSIGLCSALSLILNLAILLVLVRSKLAKSNPIYVLSAMNLFSDCLQNAGILLFLAPTSIAQDFLLDWARPNQPIWLFFMLLFQFQWYSSLLVLTAVAINRLIAVVFPRMGHLISRGAILRIMIAILLLTFLLTFIADFLLPCCRTNYSFPVFSYQFFSPPSPNPSNSAVNYKNLGMDIPLNIGTSAVLLLSYGIIFAKVLKANRNQALQGNKELVQNRRIAEIRYAAQFGLISCFFIATWLSFRVLPLIVSPSSQPEWFALTTFLEIGNCSANALIYLTMNREVKQHCYYFYAALFGCKTLPLNRTTMAPISAKYGGMSHHPSARLNHWVGLKHGQLAAKQMAAAIQQRNLRMPPVTGTC